MIVVSSIYPEAIRLDRFLRSILGPIPQNTLEKICRKKKIRINGKAAEPKTRVMTRDEVTLVDTSVVPEAQSAMRDLRQYARAVIAAQVGIQEKPASSRESRFRGNDNTQHTPPSFKSLILHDAPNFCIINKPYGLPSQGGPGITESVDTLAGEGYWIVHRLDRNTEGIMIVAKNRQTATHFMELFKTRKIQKYYYAVTRGRPSPDSGTINLPLKNICVEGDDKMIVDPNGQKALTRYRVVKVLNRHHTLVLLKPLTGRKHQLRAHLAALGTPILGDSKYGKRAERMHLYAYKVSFPGFQFSLTTAASPLSPKKDFGASHAPSSS